MFKKKTFEVQQELLAKGYKYIEFCDIEQVGIECYHHYRLSKDDEIAKPDSCILYRAIRLDDEEALEILERYMNPIIIHPDLNNL